MEHIESGLAPLQDRLEPGRDKPGICSPGKKY
jgi:hypothetical protein